MSVSEVGARGLPNGGTRSFPDHCGFRYLSPFISCLIVLQRSWVNIFISWLYLPVVNNLLPFSEHLTKFNRQDKEDTPMLAGLEKL